MSFLHPEVGSGKLSLEFITMYFFQVELCRFFRGWHLQITHIVNSLKLCESV